MITVKSVITPTTPIPRPVLVVMTVRSGVIPVAIMILRVLGGLEGIASLIVRAVFVRRGQNSLANFLGTASVKFSVVIVGVTIVNTATFTGWCCHQGKWFAN